MAVPPLFAEVEGRDTITCTVPLLSGRRVHVEAVADPMTLGFDVLVDMAENDTGVIPLLTKKGLIHWQIALPKPYDLIALCKSWALAAGLGEYGFGRLVSIMRHLDLVEADLQRFYQVDLTDWPAGNITTRRVVVLISGLWHETDSLFWSELTDRDPLTKEAIVLAQLASSPNDPHQFLVSREQRRQQEEDAAAIERMRNRGLSG